MLAGVTAPPAETARTAPALAGSLNLEKFTEICKRINTVLSQSYAMLTHCKYSSLVGHHVSHGRTPWLLTRRGRVLTQLARTHKHRESCSEGRAALLLIYARQTR